MLGDFEWRMKLVPSVLRLTKDAGTMQLETHIGWAQVQQLLVASSIRKWDCKEKEGRSVKYGYGLYMFIRCSTSTNG